MIHEEFKNAEQQINHRIIAGCLTFPIESTSFLELNKRLNFDNKKFRSSPFKQKWDQLADKERVRRVCEYLFEALFHCYRSNRSWNGIRNSCVGKHYVATYVVRMLT